MDKEKIAILDGEYADRRYLEVFEEKGLELVFLENLYEEPEKLKRLPEIDPEYIFIWTTGMNAGGRKQYRKNLISIFKELDWIPDNVVFFNDDSVFTFRGIAKELKKHGTNFYFPPYFGDRDFREINWI